MKEPVFILITGKVFNQTSHYNSEAYDLSQQNFGGSNSVSNRSTEYMFSETHGSKFRLWPTSRRNVLSCTTSSVPPTVRHSHTTKAFRDRHKVSALYVIMKTNNTGASIFRHGTYIFFILYLRGCSRKT